MQAVIIILLLMIVINYIKSNQNLEKRLPHYRMKMEEVFDNQVNTSNNENGSSDRLVSFLVENVKELFVPPDNSTMSTHGHGTFDFAPFLDFFKPSTESISYKNPLVNNSLVTGLDSFHLPFLRLKNHVIYSISNSSKETDIRLLNILKNIDLKTEKPNEDDLSTFKRTCIFCDNILNEECSDPGFKLVLSIDCQRENDLCYSQYTPFGIVDRGCFNVNHGLTLFVCACNLCNYISISEMPYIFSNKRDWIGNVIELSRAKRLRESILKDMSCLRCEVNVTAKRRDTVADADCLEGNIATLPSQVCASDEICAVKAVRSEGYVWRGCVSEPLYNYWWTFCDNDLCNHDAIVSVYDTMN